MSLCATGIETVIEVLHYVCAIYEGSLNFVWLLRTCSERCTELKQPRLGPAYHMSAAVNYYIRSHTYTSHAT
jgi:hypothetical protein